MKSSSLLIFNNYTHKRPSFVLHVLENVTAIAKFFAI